MTDGPGRRRTQSRSTWQYEWVAAVAFTLLVLAPVISVVITRSWRPYTPTGDIGVTDLRIWDVWNGHIPLVGPFSRYGWSHPGPAMFLFLAVPSRIFGRAPWVTLVGGAALQGIAIGSLAWLAWKRGRLPLLMTVMTAVSLVYASTGAWVVLVPWNPYIALPFFCLLVFQAWMVATGDPGQLPGLILVASFLMQTHVGYLPLAAAALVFVAVCVYRDRAPGMWSDRWRRPVILAAAVGVVMWIPPVIDVIIHPPGNLAHMAKYFLVGDPHEHAAGLGKALQLMAAEFRVRPAWLGSSDSAGFLRTGATASAALLLVPLALLFGSWWWTRRLPARDARRMLLLSALLLVVGVVELARVTGWPFPYLFLWRPAVAVLVVFSSAAVLVVAHRFLRHRQVRIVLGVLAVSAVGVFSGSMASAVLTHPQMISPLEPITRSMIRQIADRIPKQGVILRLDTTSLAALQKGIVDGLARRGEHVFVDDWVAYQYGSQYSAKPSEVASVWWVAESGYATTVLSDLPGAKVIASYSPLPAEQERRLRRLQRNLAHRFVAEGHAEFVPLLDSPLLAFAVHDLPDADMTVVDEVARLNDRASRAGGLRSSIVAFPPTSAPKTVPYSQYVDLG